MMKSTMLQRFATYGGKYPFKIILLSLLISVIMGYGSTLVKSDMTFFSMFPDNTEEVRDLHKIVDEFPFASSIVTVVDGRGLPEETARETVIATIDEIVDHFGQPEYKEFVPTVYGKADIDFIKKHGFMATRTDVVKRMEKLYSNVDLQPFFTALNNDLEQVYSGDSDAVENDEAALVSWVAGLEQILTSLADTLEGQGLDEQNIGDALEAFMYGNPYFLSRNQNVGLVYLNPSYTLTEIGELQKYTPIIIEDLKAIGKKHGVDVGITGMTAIGYDETRTGQEGVAISALISLCLILLLVILVFRMPSAPLMVGIPLLLGIFWTVGLTGFVLQKLTIVTTIFMVALIGLGVDYALHILTSYMQARDAGKSFMEALQVAYSRTGRSVISGAITSVVAFFSLLATSSHLMRELGIVAGLGLIAELFAIFLLLPAFLGLREKGFQRKGKEDPAFSGSRKVYIRSDFASGLGSVVSKYPGVIAVSFILIALAIGTQIPKVRIEKNLMNMEAKGLKSIELQDVMANEFDVASDYLYMFFSKDEMEEIPAIAKELKDLDSVKDVISVTQVMPTDSQYQERLPYLENLQSAINSRSVNGSYEPAEVPVASDLLEELYRLEANLIEMGDLSTLAGTDSVSYALNQITGLNSDGEKVTESIFDRLFNELENEKKDFSELLSSYQAAFSPAVAERALAMANPEKITPELLPDAMRDSFLSEDGESTLLTIVPTQNPWEGEFRNVFTSQIKSVTSKATGILLAADEFAKIMSTDSISALFVSFFAVLIILLIDFRNIRMSLLNFIPVLFSFACLLGLMGYFDIKFNMLNIIVIPLLIGIGIDSSIHISHRYLEGKSYDVKEVLSKTGTALLLTTLTTVIAFASFIVSIMRGVRSMGIVLSIALTLAFVFSVMLYPAILNFVVKRLKWNLHVWGSKIRNSNNQ